MQGMRVKAGLILLAAIMGFSVDVAEAYVGPGAGITMLGALWAVLMALVMAIGAIVYWPIRAWRRRARRAKDVQAGSALERV